MSGKRRRRLLRLAALFGAAPAGGSTSSPSSTTTSCTDAIDRLLLPPGRLPIYRLGSLGSVTIEIDVKQSAGGTAHVSVSVEPYELAVPMVEAELMALPEPPPKSELVLVTDYIYDHVVAYEPRLPSLRYPAWLSKTAFLQELATLQGYKGYLEIGCETNVNFDAMAKVPGLERTCVDPHQGGTHRSTSDEFFAQYQGPGFDIVFVDGLHEQHQVLRDVENSLRWLSPGGTIVVHDCTPRSRSKAQNLGASFEGGRIWNGDVFRAIMQLRCRSDLNVYVGDLDFGVGVVRRALTLHPTICAHDVPGWNSAWGQGEVTRDEWAFFRRHEVALLDLMPALPFLERTLCEGWRPPQPPPVLPLPGAHSGTVYMV